MANNPFRTGLVFAGEVHYFRLQRSEWESRLDALKESGLDTVASCIPWLCHEPHRLDFDLTGRTRPELDLGAFVDLCGARGLRFFARPGPFVMAELKNEGIPYRLYRDHPELISPTWKGLPVPNKNLDYSGPAFLAATKGWYHEVAEVLRPRRWSVGGPVTAVQLDNEIGMLSWVAGTPDLSERVIADFGVWLGEQFSPRQVLDRYGFVPGASHLEDFWVPQESWSLALVHDLGHFMRKRFSRYVGFLSDVLDDEGLGDLVKVVNVHGTGGGRGHPFPIGISQLLGTWQDHRELVVGTDISLGDLGVHNVADLYLLNAATRSTLLPGQRLGSVEFEAGDGDYGANTGMRYDPSAADLKARLCLRQGQTLLNYYLYAGGRNYRLDEPPGDGNDRIAFTGERQGSAAPIDPEGHRNTTWERLGRTVRAARTLADHLTDATEETDALVYGFVPDWWMTDAIPPDSASAKALRDDLQQYRSSASWDLFARWALLRGFRFGAVDLSRSLPPVTQVLFMGSCAHLDAGTQQKLAGWVGEGGRLVLWGTLPSKTLEGQPCTVLADALGSSAGDVLEARPGFHLSVVPEGPLAGWAESSVGRAVTFRVGDQATVLSRTFHSAQVTAFLTPAGQGTALVLGSDVQGRPEFVRDLLALLDCHAGLTHDAPGAALLLGSTRDSDGGRVLHVLNLDGCETVCHLRDRGDPLFDGLPLRLAAKEGRMLPLGLFPTGGPGGVRVLWSTAELEGADTESLTLRRNQPEDSLLVVCPDGHAPEASDDWVLVPGAQSGHWLVRSARLVWPGTLVRLAIGVAWPEAD